VIEDGKVLIKNQKLCIPGPVQEKVIHLVHQGNQGVQKLKNSSESKFGSHASTNG
jgi:hypothetical protein